jgi:hypothetical protein
MRGSLELIFTPLSLSPKHKVEGGMRVWFELLRV